MTQSRRRLFTVFGVVVPIVALAAAPASAATSTPIHNKSRSHHASAETHKGAKPHRPGSVHHAAHQASHHPTRKLSVS